MTKHSRAGVHSQRGVILIVSLIMLIALTLLGVSVINLSTVNLRIVNNMQVKMEAVSSAQRMIDRVLSTDFSESAARIVAVAGTTAVSVGGQSYDVTLRRPCVVGLSTINVNELVDASGNPKNDESKKCIGTTTDPMGNKTQSSECAKLRWQLRGQVASGWFGASATVCQAAGVTTDKVLSAEYARTYACVAASDNC